MKRIKSHQISGRPEQSGAAAIEFALVFPILLAVAYGGLVYSYVFFLQQAINFAAQQGVQAAVAIVPTANSTTDQNSRAVRASAVALSSLSWLPAGQFGRVTTSRATSCPGTAPGVNTFSYTVNFSLGGAGGALFPTLVNLPMGLGTIPPLPASLSACAVAFL